MPETMSRWERLDATIKKEPLDRIPYSFWRHFYDRETSAEDTAAAMLDWQRQHDFDLLKVNPRAQYHAEAWGARYSYSDQPHVKPRTLAVPVTSAEDWQRLEVLSPTTGPLGEQLRTLQLIGRGLGADVPFVQTVFSPLGVASYLAGDDAVVLAHLREQPRLLHQGLGAIAQTLIAFVRAVLDTGASGIFFATTHWATHSALTDAEYDEFGRPYDLQVLRAAATARANVLHVCKENNRLRHLLDYPASLLHWAATSPTNPTLADIAEQVDDKAVMGGIGDEALMAADPRQALAEAEAARTATGGRGWIMAGDCSIPTRSRDEVIQALRAWCATRD